MIQTSSNSTPTVVIEPIAEEISPVPKVSDILRKAANLPGLLLLDSSMRPVANGIHPLGRYSFMVAHPFETVSCQIGESDPLKKIRNELNRFVVKPLDGLPPFQGGLAGLLSYDLNQSLEVLPTNQVSHHSMPSVALGCYDAVLAWDHSQNRCWIISTGLPHVCEDKRLDHATQVKDRWLQLIQTAAEPKIHPSESKSNEFPAFLKRCSSVAVGTEFELFSNFNREEYLRAVQKCIDYIYAGDVFQINLAQNLFTRSTCSAADLFMELSHCNPAPFSGYIDLTTFGVDAQVISASPERFFSVRDKIVETRPIKGTRRRTGTPMVDIWSRSKLESSIKDRAENTMIVDLMRNDLSRCCLDNSIQVTQLCELEEYQSVIHLVSSVRGELRPECDLVDLIAATFPGGSITGAPKIRAMEIIAELEPHRRGAYCGGLGYLGFDGNADFNILIRTITNAAGWLQIPVGGGIISQSDPAAEYEETWTKAAGLLRAISAGTHRNGVGD